MLRLGKQVILNKNLLNATKFTKNVSPKINISVRFFSSEKLGIPTDLEQQAGRRREEIDAEARGEVAFNLDPIVPDVKAGTKENPILVSSFYCHEMCAF